MIKHSHFKENSLCAYKSMCAYQVENSILSKSYQYYRINPEHSGIMTYSNALAFVNATSDWIISKICDSISCVILSEII